MLNQIKQFVQNQGFNPGVAGILVNPFWIARRGLAKGVAKYAPLCSGPLLDVGCGSQPYKSFFSISDYVGLEIDSAQSRAMNLADFYYDGLTFPFGDSSFNSVLCNQVLEHVFHPSQFISEINRVLKTSGYLLLTVPFVWDEHEQPFDYARYSSFGLNSLLVNHGFEIVKHEKINSDFSVIIQLINAYIYKILPNDPKTRLLLCVLLMAPVTAFGILLAKILPINPDLYLDQIVLAQKKGEPKNE